MRSVVGMARRALLAGALSAVGLAACAAPTVSSTTPPTTTTTSATTTTAATTTTSAEAVTTTTTLPAAPTTNLALGASGPAVLSLQQRLEALHYWLGAPDGRFGDSTEQAVYALQKAGGIPVDGVVGPQTAAVLARGTEPAFRSASGLVVEVDLAHQLLMVVEGGRLEAVLNTSTGGGYSYVESGVSQVADTPVGVFHVSRAVDGMVTSPLGQLWRPLFFYAGYAIHGYPEVPAYPVSHGCVRVSNEAIDWIWADQVIPVGTEVWIY